MIINGGSITITPNNGTYRVQLELDATSINVEDMVADLRPLFGGDIDVMLDKTTINAAMAASQPHCVRVLPRGLLRGRDRTERVALALLELTGGDLNRAAEKEAIAALVPAEERILVHSTLTGMHADAPPQVDLITGKGWAFTGDGLKRAKMIRDHGH